MDIEFEQTLGDGEGQGSLACCSPWGRKEMDVTERQNNNNHVQRFTKKCDLRGDYNRELIYYLVNARE